MPVKRRNAKGRAQLDHEEMLDHFYGPGTALLAGLGYCWQVCGKSIWPHMNAKQRRQAVDLMRADWERHARAIRQAWDDRDAHALYLAREHHGDPARPWSETQFK